jgi:crotonobetainyl-CoA:carnitine CoA-transferase CaiB-like acyl-CoA transferase
MRAPLAGITVIEVGQALAGPLAGAILGDMGAEIIKIEKPEGGDHPLSMVLRSHSTPTTATSVPSHSTSRAQTTSRH